MSSFTDNLDGTAGTFLRNRTGWSRPTGADDAVLDSTTGYRLTNGTTTASSTWHAPTSQPSGNDQYVEALVASNGNTACFQLGVRCDTSTANGQAYLCRRPSDTSLQLYFRNSSGALSLLGSYTGTKANLDANKARLEVTGTSISVKFMGSTVIGPVTNTSIASGSVAILTRGGSASTRNIDDWESGDLTSSASSPVGNALETDLSLALARLAVRAASLASETDLAQSLNRLAVGLASVAVESDTAFALGRIAKSNVGVALEANTSFALSRLAYGTAKVALETETALALSSGGVAVGTAVETGTAFNLGVSYKVGVAVSSGTAFSLTGKQAKALGFAVESEAAYSLNNTYLQSVGMAVELNAAYNLNRTQPSIIAYSSEQALALLGINYGISLTIRADRVMRVKRRERVIALQSRARTLEVAKRQRVIGAS